MPKYFHPFSHTKYLTEKESIVSSKSKTKGASYERDVAKFLSETYSGSFVRAAHSGAFIGGTNAFRKNHLSDNQIKSFKGDIIPPDDWKKFNAEVKNYADFPFHLMLLGNCKQLDTWLGQLLSVSDEGDLDVLFIKITRKGKYIAVKKSLDWNTGNNYNTYNSDAYGDWIFMDFDQFFTLNKELFKIHSTVGTQQTE